MARKADWQDTLVNLTVASGAQSVSSLMAGLTASDSRGLTVTRTIVSLTLLPPVAVSDGYQGAFVGIGVTSQEAFAASIVPDPNNAFDRPPRGWLFRAARTVIGAAALVPYSPQMIEVDIRGKRKLDNGELFLAVNNDAVGGTPFSLTVRGFVRVVFLLP